MSTQLVLATDNGIFIMEKDGDSWRDINSTYHQHRFTSVTHRQDTILAGAADGLYRSTDKGQTWHQAGEGLVYTHLRSLAIHPDDTDLAFAGTEPASVHYSLDGGQTWRYCPEVADLRDRYGWYLPYSPNAGAVRGFALFGQRAYAAVEQGGLLVSDDTGQTWRLVNPDEDESLASPSEPWIHKDVHSVKVHPSSEDQVFAPTGGGFYYSTSGGRGWTKLHKNYCRAVWVDPLRADHLILGPADGPDRNGWIVETPNGGSSWERRMDGFEDHTWQNSMVEEFHPAGGELIALLSNGTLIAAAPDTLQWRPILTAFTDVRAVSVLSE